MKYSAYNVTKHRKSVWFSLVNYSEINTSTSSTTQALVLAIHCGLLVLNHHLSQKLKLIGSDKLNHFIIF